MMTVHPDQADKKCKHRRMNCRPCYQLQLVLYGLDSIIDTQMLEKLHDILVHLEDLDYGRKTDIGTFNKERGDIFSEFCIKSFKEKIPHCVDEVPLETVKTSLKDAYLGGVTTTAL